MTTRRQQIRRLHSTFVELFTDVLVCIKNIEAPAFDDELHRKVNKLHEYLDLLRDLDSPIKYQNPQPSNFVIDVPDTPKEHREAQLQVKKRHKPQQAKSPDHAPTISPKQYIIESIDGYDADEDTLLIKWKNYAKRTWEPSSIVAEANAADLFDAFKAKWNKKHPDQPF